MGSAVPRLLLRCCLFFGTVAFVLPRGPFLAHSRSITSAFSAPSICLSFFLPQRRAICALSLSLPPFLVCAVAPFDMVRTRLMNQPADAKIYNGFVDCTVKILKQSGPKGLYAGFIPIWARFAPTTTLQLVIFEQIKPVFGVTGSGE